MHAATAGPAHILVVDDEPAITDLLATALRYMGYRVSTAASGHDALDAAASAHAGPRRARRHAPRHRRLRGLPPAARGARLRAGDLPLRPRHRGRPRHRLRPRRRRLRHQAVLARGADAPHRRAPAARPRRRRGRRPAPLPRPRDGRGPPPGLARRRGGRALPDGVPAAALLPAQPRAGPLEAADPRPRLAVRLQRRGQRRRDLRQLPAAQGRRSPSRACSARCAGSATCSAPTAAPAPTDR